MLLVKAMATEGCLDTMGCGLRGGEEGEDGGGERKRCKLVVEQEDILGHRTRAPVQTRMRQFPPETTPGVHHTM